MESVKLEEQYPTRTSPQPGREGAARNPLGSRKRPLAETADSSGELGWKRRQFYSPPGGVKKDGMAEAGDEISDTDTIATEPHNGLGPTGLDGGIDGGSQESACDRDHDSARHMSMRNESVKHIESDEDTISHKDMDTIRVDDSNNDPDNDSPGGSQETDSDDYLASPKSMHEEYEKHKYAPYRDKSYQHVFSKANIFTIDTADRFSQANTDLCHKLLGKSEQSLPETPFDNAVVEACKSVKGIRNKETILFGLTSVIIPALDDALKPEERIFFCESVYEKWSSSCHITDSAPQPDLAIGFGSEAFKSQIDEAEELLNLLQAPQIQQQPRSNQRKSLFQGAPSMFFPFFSCEVGDIDLAQPHNTHCMVIGMSSIVMLFRAIGRLHELDGKILASLFGMTITRRRFSLITQS
jgi:hypothetical protein